MGLSSTENHVDCYLSGFWLLPHDIRVKFIWFKKYPDSSEGAQENKQKKNNNKNNKKDFIYKIHQDPAKHLPANSFNPP